MQQSRLYTLAIILIFTRSNAQPRSVLFLHCSITGVPHNSLSKAFLGWDLFCSTAELLLFFPPPLLALCSNVIFPVSPGVFHTPSQILSASSRAFYLSSSFPGCYPHLFAAPWYRISLFFSPGGGLKNK